MNVLGNIWDFLFGKKDKQAPSVSAPTNISSTTQVNTAPSQATQLSSLQRRDPGSQQTSQTPSTPNLLSLNTSLSKADTQPQAQPQVQPQPKPNFLSQVGSAINNGVKGFVNHVVAPVEQPLNQLAANISSDITGNKSFAEKQQQQGQQLDAQSNPYVRATVGLPFNYAAGVLNSGYNALKKAGEAGQKASQGDLGGAAWSAGESGLNALGAGFQVTNPFLSSGLNIGAGAIDKTLSGDNPLTGGLNNVGMLSSPTQAVLSHTPLANNKAANLILPFIGDTLLTHNPKNIIEDLQNLTKSAATDNGTAALNNVRDKVGRFAPNVGRLYKPSIEQDAQAAVKIFQTHPEMSGEMDAIAAVMEKAANKDKNSIQTLKNISNHYLGKNATKLSTNDLMKTWGGILDQVHGVTPTASPADVGVLGFVGSGKPSVPEPGVTSSVAAEQSVGSTANLPELPNITPAPPVEVAAATPPPVVQAEVGATPASPPVAPESQPVAAQPSQTTPLSLPEQTANIQAPSGVEVPVAPRTYDAAVKQIGDLARSLPGNGSQQSTDLASLASQSQAIVANLSPEEILHIFSSNAVDQLPHDAKGFSVLRAARDKLSQMYQQDPKNPDIANAMANVLDKMTSRASSGGLLNRVVQEEFDTLPLPAKVNYLIKKIDAANKDTKNYEPLSSNPAQASLIDATLTAYLQKSQSISETIAQLEGKMQQFMDAATRGEKVDPQVIASVRRDLTTARRTLAQANGETVKYFTSLVPGRTAAQRALSDFPRSMMLSSFSGRANDLLTTGSNVANLTATNVVQGMLSKAANRVKPGFLPDTTKGVGRLFSGALEGAKQTIGEIKGNQYAPNLEQGVRNNVELRSGLTKAKGPVGRTIQAATEFATNLSQGVRDQRLYQLADQEAAQQGLTGALRQQYAEARAALPTRQMRQNAEFLHQQVNNLNSNPISQKLASVSASIGGDSAIGGLLKNQILPFTSWIGGNIWNSVTDKNVIANVVKMVGAASKGDAEGFVRNLSSAATGTATAYAIGYQLTKMGVLSPTNAEGYSDGGLYLHLGGRYIPVGVLGFFAPNIVLGNAAYNGLHADGQNPAEVIASDIGRFAWNGLTLGNALGVENNVSQAYQAATRPGGSPLDAASTFAANTVGQFIPAITGDINSLLDNGVGIPGSDALNPTHEKANTRAQSTAILKSGKQSTAKDYPASAVNQVVNRIPVASQLALSRKTGVAAPDLVDRAVRGDRSTPTQVDAAKKAQDLLAQQKDFKARDIPLYTDANFSNAIEARIERGQYPAAIEGLQAKLAHDQANKDIPASTLKKQQDQITALKVAQKEKIGPNTIQLYKDTSLSEWRNMGDPNSDTYNPGLYELLWQYDSALAKAGVSRNTTDTKTNFYSAKKLKGRSGRSLANGSTLSSIPDLGRITFGKLSGQQVNAPQIPVIKKLSQGELVKKRKISVG